MSVKENKIKELESMNLPEDVLRFQKLLILDLPVEFYNQSQEEINKQIEEKIQDHIDSFSAEDKVFFDKYREKVVKKKRDEIEFMKHFETIYNRIQVYYIKQNYMEINKILFICMKLKNIID